MSNGVILLGVDEFFRSRLLADAGLDTVMETLNGGALSLADRVWGDSLPDEAPLPAILFQNQTNLDVRGLGATRIMNNSVYLVRVLHRVNAYDPLGPVAARIDAVLDGAQGSIASGEVIGTAREQEFRLEERSGDVRIRHLGGLYRVSAK